ncbi:MAG: hypothetical protein DI587_03305 [Variovorax paradoxus]|nr:MAG: hypothetical protein DI583_03305 [Variovorax paradoxus]PZQ15726.1 MAG: hypothetical protein DI587_03305 [Variovorax paradoxus]
MRIKTIKRTTDAEKIELARLAIYGTSTTKTGQVRSVRDFVDMMSGEAIPADQLSIGVLDLRKRYPAREAALASLRPQVLPFALFVLRFANKRRGITPGIAVLSRWYADLHDKQTKNVRRYIPALLKAGILAGDTLLGPLFQHTRGAARDHLGEDFRAWCIYQKLERDGRQFPLSARGAPCTNSALVAAEVARLDVELVADVQSWAAILKASRTSGADVLRPIPA